MFFAPDSATMPHATGSASGEPCYLPAFQPIIDEPEKNDPAAQAAGSGKGLTGQLAIEPSGRKRRVPPNRSNFIVQIRHQIGQIDKMHDDFCYEISIKVECCCAATVTRRAGGPLA
jgi:hypothetical protein